MRSVYIHIPFCNSICSYCDFCKMYYNEKLVNEYLDILEEEVKTRYLNDPIRTIYIGGGTPSSLNLKQLKRLFKIIDLFDNKYLEEFTFEVNLDSINLEKILFLKDHLVSRISIGIETINKKILHSINRHHTENEIITKINMIKDYIPNINVDLMFGFKDETIEVLKKDLDFITNLDIKHISLYSLIIEEHTVFSINKYKRLSEDQDRVMYDYIRKYLFDKGFNHYEISNFCKEGYESRHNLVYWDNLEYYGFGLSAGFYINSIRGTNTRSINKYLDKNYIFAEETIDKKDDMIYEIILGLRKIEGINIDMFNKKYNVNLLELFDIIELVNRNVLVVNDGYLYINENYLYVSNSILERFLDI